MAAVGSLAFTAMVAVSVAVVVAVFCYLLYALVPGDAAPDRPAT